MISSQLAVKWATRIREINSEKPIEKKAMFEYMRLAFAKMEKKYSNKYGDNPNQIVQNFEEANLIMNKLCSLRNVDSEKNKTD